MRGQRDLGRVAADVRAVAVQHVTLTGELFGRAADEVPVLGVLRGRAQRALLAAAADADRRVRLLHPLRLAPGVGEPVVLALERRGLLRQQPDEDFAGFLEPVAALLDRTELHAVRARFLFVPAGADADLQPSAGDDVERRGHVRQQRGVSVVDAADQGAQPEPLGRLRQRGERHPAFQAGPGRIGENGIEVVEGPAGFEQLDFVGGLPHGEHAGPFGVLGGGFDGESHDLHRKPGVAPERRSSRGRAAAGPFPRQVVARPGHVPGRVVGRHRFCRWCPVMS